MEPQVAQRGVTPRVAAAEDTRAVAAVLARAFQADPAMSWIWPDEERRRAGLPRLFANAAEKLYLRYGLVYLADDAGAAIWAPPGHWKVGFLTQLRLGPRMIRTFGGGLFRALKVLSLCQPHHPAEPHYYLFAVGADPARQGQGVGSSLLAPVLARCDAEKVAAHLENSNPKNTPFYRRHGFQPVEEIQLPGGPPILIMTRPPS